MNPNEPPPKEALPPTADEIARQRRARLEAAVTPQGSGYSGWRERYTPPPDYPLQPCDFKKWAKFDSLPIERACFVLLGYEPPPLHVLKFVQDTYDPSREPTWDKPPDYYDVLASLRVSIAHGNISVKRIREGQYETKQVTLPDLVRWARTKEYAIAPELEPIIAKMGPATSAAPAQQDTAPPALVVAADASGGVEPDKAGLKVGEGSADAPKRETQQAAGSPKFSMRLSALIEAHIHEWPTIETDIKAASDNDLSAAKAGARGWWEEHAMNWARANGKLKIAAKPGESLAQATHNMVSLPSRKHRVEG